MIPGGGPGAPTPAPGSGAERGAGVPAAGGVRPVDGRPAVRQPRPSRIAVIRRDASRAASFGSAPRSTRVW
ncbi:hypothetical protein GCM10023079_20160 [Streptomyces chitinivorans]